MRHRNPPDPNQYRANFARVASDPQTKAWAKRLLGDSSAVPSGLSEAQLAFIGAELIKRREEDFRQDAYLAEMQATCPVLAFPDMTDPVEDLEHMWHQPEMLGFWAGMTGTRKLKGPPPRFGWAKALIATLSMTGRSTHAEDMWNDLSREPRWAASFAAIDRAAVELSDARGQEPHRTEDWERVPHYGTPMRLLARIAPRVREQGLIVNIEMLKALREFHPGIGRRLLIDGTDHAAWCQQRGREDKVLDRLVSPRVPQARHRMLTHSSTGKRAVEKGDDAAALMRSGSVKSWRGYYDVALIDQASGLPVVWTQIPADVDEASALVSLLSRLYELWPDVGVEEIVGDSAWDEDPWCKLCELNYGIHPIFRIHPSSARKLFDGPDDHDASVIGIGGKGQLICTHGTYLPYETASTPARPAGLRPGREHPNPGAFRVRGTCESGTAISPACGRPGVKMEKDWSRLTYYPHYAEGHQRRFAHRQAMLTRLNQVESFFNHLRSGLKVGTRGGDRNRILDQDIQEAMLTLACVATTALVLADQRIERGIDVRADIAAEITAARAGTPTSPDHHAEHTHTPEPATATTRHPLRRPSAPAGQPRSPGVQPPRNITLPAGAVDPAITVNDDGTLSVSFTLAA